MSHNVTTIIIVITIKVIIFISSEPVRKDTIGCILLLQKFRIIISSIIALITNVKEPHQFSLAWCELVVCEGFIQDWSSSLRFLPCLHGLNSVNIVAQQYSLSPLSHLRSDPPTKLGIRLLELEILT